MEVAIDFALQCAPDHPWAAAHPEWFTVLPDGTIAFAENPPKKYQDIYPINFDSDPSAVPGAPSPLYLEVLRVLRLWVDRGVRIFRVDNPHTKPPDFWAWVIAEVKRTDPDVLFLAEAFTRPARLYGLAKLGFTQSYTYFTWRTAKHEIVEFGEELAAKADQARPNLFVNTPDILHESLQHGGPGMFALRAVLAATLSPTWGVYSGYELYEHEAVREGSEEYLDSEKYELRPRDFAGALSARRVPRAVPGPAQPDPARPPGAGAAAHAALPRHQQRGGRVAYSKVDPSHRRRRARGVHAEPVRRRGGHRLARPACAGPATGTTGSPSSTRSPARTTSGARPTTSGWNRGAPSRTSWRCPTSTTRRDVVSPTVRENPRAAAPGAGHPDDPTR